MRWRTALSNFIKNGSTAITKEIASRYVDDVISLILSKTYGANLDVSVWAGESSPIFEFFHARKRLKEKGRQISELLKTLDRDPAATADQRRPVLLSYLLQGRDPLIALLPHTCTGSPRLPKENEPKASRR